MKKMFFILLFSVVSSVVFSQQGSKETLTHGKIELAKSKESGIFNFVLPQGNTKESVIENSKYYTMYFTVEYLSEKNEAIVKMINNDEKSRHVIFRFLVASGTEKVKVDDKIFEVEQFFKEYLK